MAFGGILEREVSGRGVNTMCEQSATRKLNQKEHRYLWAEVNKSVGFGNLRRWQILLLLKQRQTEGPDKIKDKSGFS